MFSRRRIRDTTGRSPWSGVYQPRTATAGRPGGGADRAEGRRRPVLTARLAADLQRLSGRLVLGLGIGDYPEEFDAMGLPYPSVRERQEALAELIPIVARLLAGESVTVDGRHFRVREARLRPGSAPEE